MSGRSGPARRYRAAIRAAVSSESKAYGFALVIWGTGALAGAARGEPGRAGTIAYIGGALVAMALVILVSFGGPGGTWSFSTMRHYALGAIHLGSVAAAIGAGWGMAELVVTKWVSYFVAGAVATLVYQLLLGLEVAATAIHDGDDGNSRQEPRRRNESSASLPFSRVSRGMR